MKTSIAYALLLLIGACKSQTGSCNGVDSWMGDGLCDPQNLSSECDWDGGDCCRCTCEDEEFICGTDGYLCLDPTGVDNNATCEEELPLPCSVESQHLVVENATQATTLAENVNCSGGVFHVEWRGYITVDTEIVVSFGTVLNITGVGSGAVLDGVSKTRLFRVVNSSLHLTDVVVRKGSATFGGAVAAINSTLTLHRTSFVNNTATDKNGGALFLYRSDVIFSGQTEFFYNSCANYGGGLYAVSNSSAVWEGVSSFIGNSASHSGGALGVAGGSTVSWAAETTFEGNSALTYRGGALFLEDESSALWSTYTSFIANNAYYEGGAIFVDLGSIAIMSEGGLYSNNSATYAGGGAILIADFSTLDLAGETTFELNEAGSEGGAVSSRALESVTSTFSANQASSLLINGPTIFANNTCGSSGGALAILSGLSVSFETSNVEFIGNKGVSGGAAFISVTGVGPVFRNVSFRSNSAQTGGAVFISGTGTSGDTSDEELSVNFEECTFNVNEATATGGAIMVSTGTVAMRNTLFKGNTADNAGALALSSATSVNWCTFEENLSGVNGVPAVSKIGYSLDMGNCSFSGNALNCGVGTFLNESVGVRFDTVCSGCGECDTCTVENPWKVPTTCSAALEHSSSPGGSLVTLETLLIDPGYWRATNVSTTIMACYNEEACAGGLTGSPEFCNEGYTGPYCSVCTDNYAKSSGFTCTKCTENVWGAVAAVIALVIAVAVTFAAVEYVVTVEMRARRGILVRLLRRVPLQSAKIIIVAWQIVTQFATVADVTFPGVYQSFLNAVDALNFDLTWMISAGCIAAVNFHGQLLIVTIGPAVVVLFLSGTYAYALKKHGSSEEVLMILRHKHVSMILLVMFLVYSTSSSVVFQMFDCEVLDDGKDYLRADYTIECDSPRHRALMIYSGVMIILFPLGIPAFFAYLLFRHRNVLLDETNREDTLSVKSISDLWEPYRPSRFYYEVIECGRRIVLTGVVLVVEGDSAAKIAVTLMLAFTFTVVSEGLAPYSSQLDAWVSRLGHAVVVATMYYALLLKVDISNETQASQNAFEVVLIVIHVAMVVAVISETVVTGYSMSIEEVTEPWSRFNRYRSPRTQFTISSVSRESIGTWDGLYYNDIDVRAPRPAPLHRSNNVRSLEASVARPL